MKLSATMPTTEIAVGDPVIVKVTLENRSGQPMEYDYHLADFDFKIDVVDYDTGEFIPWTKYGEEVQDSRKEWVGSEGRLKLGNDKGVTYTIRLDRLYDLTIPRNYAFRVRLFMPLKTSDVTEMHCRDYTLESNEVIFRLENVPGTPTSVEPLN